MTNAILSVELGALITADIILSFLVPTLHNAWVSQAFASELFSDCINSKWQIEKINCFPNEFRETQMETLTLKTHFS